MKQKYHFIFNSFVSLKGNFETVILNYHLLPPLSVTGANEKASLVGTKEEQEK